MNVLRNRWLILSLGSGLITTGLVLYYIWKYPQPSVYGEQFIKDEFSPLLFVQFKPITLIFIFGFLFYASLIQHFEKRITAVSHDVRIFLFMLSFLITVGSIYELFFNFALWGSLMSITGVVNPDMLVNRFPSPKTAVSLVYASKIVILVFAVSSYSMYFLHRIERAPEARSRTSSEP